MSHSARWETDSRYYMIIMQTDLIGDLTLLRIWGSRQSGLGSHRVDVLPHSAECGSVISRIAADRRRHGYRLVRSDFPASLSKAMQA